MVQEDHVLVHEEVARRVDEPIRKLGRDAVYSPPAWVFGGAVFYGGATIQFKNEANAA